MPDLQRQPSTLEATASILGALGKLGCLTLFLLFWIPFSAILVYAFVGKTGAIIAGVIVVGIVLWVFLKVKEAQSTWRCPYCNGRFQPFQTSSALCPHCRRSVSPPQMARSTAPPPPSAPLTDKRPTRACPDCAETVLAAARRCRYCGYEFAE